MKITFIIPAPSLSGGQRVVAIYADGLRRRGHDVHVIATLIPNPLFRQIIGFLRRGYGWSSNKPDTTYLDKFGITPHYTDPTRPLTDRDVPDGDIVIATWWETAEWVAQLSRSKGTKVYFLQDHEVFPYLPVERVAATWRMPLHKIVVSRWLADLARTEYGDPNASIVCCAVDHEQFWAPPRGKNAVPTVGLLYTRAPRKNCGLALRAFALASNRFPELKLVAFSDRAAVPELPVPRGTEFHVRPAQTKLRELYAQCDAWLFSSQTEGFGLPILEAMACRTPVIGTSAGAAPELLGDGGGIFVAADDPNDMALAIEHVSAMSEPDWMNLSDLAAVTAARYTWDNATDQFEAALQTAIENQKHRTTV